MNGQTIILASDRQRAMARRLIDLAPVNAVVNIREATRTLDQNAKMHAMLSDISRAKPQGRVMAPDKWKSVFMDAIDCKPDWVPSLDGESIVCTGYRSSRLTKGKMSDMIEQMYAYGAEHGVQWSEPEPQERAA